MHYNYMHALGFHSRPVKRASMPPRVLKSEFHNIVTGDFTRTNGSAKMSIPLVIHKARKECICFAILSGK